MGILNAFVVSIAKEIIIIIIFMLVIKRNQEVLVAKIPQLLSLGLYLTDYTSYVSVVLRLGTTVIGTHRISFFLADVTMQ